MIEIYTDASIKKYENGRAFGCAGAICPEYGKESYKILPDATNNKSEITAIYLGVILANEILISNPELLDRRVTIYSDSKISVYGLREWMPTWLDNRIGGIIYNNSGKPVKNQEVFLNILAYLTKYDLKITIRHQKGHVDVLDAKSMANANDVYRESNGYRLDSNTLTKICIYNNQVDETSRNILQDIDPDTYPINKGSNARMMAYYIPPANYNQYIS